MLGTFGDAIDDDAGGFVSDADGGGDFVDVLSSGATGAAVEIHVDFVGVDFDFGGFAVVGEDIDGGKAGVAAFVGVEGADANKSMDAHFAGEVAIGVEA